MIAKLSLAPHNKSNTDTQNIMKHVVMALVPVILASAYLYGLQVFMTYAVSIAFCVFFEYTFNKVAKLPVSINDFSAVVTGVLLAMCLPPTMPYWAIGVGSFVAIIVGKCVFGGVGQNPFNPALLGRTFLLLSFPYQTSQWIVVDQASGATTLTGYQTALTMDAEIEHTLLNLKSLLFSSGGSLGEASPLLLLLGGLYLMYRRVISWHIPVAFIGTVFVMTFALWAFKPEAMLDPFTHILSGGLLLGAFFMATDYSSSPLFKNGKLLFGIGCGLLTVLIRCFGTYPEGVAFAILIMNACVPLLDKYVRNKPFGKVKSV